MLLLSGVRFHVKVGGRRARGADLCIRQLVVFLPFHAAVLKPDFHLTLRKTHSMRYLHSSTSSKISVKVELFLKLKSLLARVGGARPLGHSSRVAGGH